MIILNLVNKDKSNIDYTISKFPDGQQQVNILKKNIYLDTGWGVPVEIRARLNNFQDLELIICAVASLRSLGVKSITLYVPYFLGSRSDRQFEAGSNNYLKKVICPIINSLNLDVVTVLDPHSDVLEACINNFNKVSNLSFVRWAFKDLTADHHINAFQIVSPDAGANKKIYKLAEELGYRKDIITCSKSRETDGQLSNIRTNIRSDQWANPFVIIDDICDGGRTFTEIAKRIITGCPIDKDIPRIYLMITHGIFSAGYKDLSKYFETVYCTNSYKDVGTSYSNGLGDVHNHNIKQLNVF